MIYRRLRSWYKWIFHGRAALVGLRNRVEELERAPVNQSEQIRMLLARISEVEQAMVQQHEQLRAEINELRDKESRRVRPKHSTFQEMRRIAELGERAAALKAQT